MGLAAKADGKSDAGGQRGRLWLFHRKPSGWTYLAFLERSSPNSGSYHINFTWVHGHLAIIHLFGITFWEHPRYQEWDDALQAKSHEEFMLQNWGPDWRAMEASGVYTIPALTESTEPQQERPAKPKGLRVI